jgi:acyl-CoA thioesterase
MTVADRAPSDLPDVLQLDEAGPLRFRVRQPRESAEGRDVVFGGQYLAQMLMAAERVNGGKDIKSIHAVFARVGTYAQPIELVVEEIQAGRTWASHAISAVQNGRLLSRGQVLSSLDDTDLIRHGRPAPQAEPPGGAPVTTLAFEGALTTDAGPAASPDGTPRSQYWHRGPGRYRSVAANQAVLAWATNGQLIGLAMRAHRDAVDIKDAHRTISTGVIAHTVHFHERFDVGAWLLIAEEATYAGRGRVYGEGGVFTEDGRLVASYSQDSMVRKIEGSLDPRSQM